MGRATRIVRAGSCVLLANALVGARCGDDSAPVPPPPAEAHQVLSLTRELEGPAPVVHAELELSQAGLEHFVALVVEVHVQSGQSLERQALVARWLDDPAAAPVESQFEGNLSNTVELWRRLTSVPCEAAPCRLTLELAPRGDWASDVPFPVEYAVDTVLTLDAEYPALDSDLWLALRVAP